MSFSLPVTIILAVVFLTASMIENKFGPQEEQAAPVIAAVPIPVDTVKIIPQPVIPAQTGTMGFRIQIFSSPSEQSARGLKDRVKYQLFYPAYVVQSDKEWKVLLGDFAAKKEAEAACAGIRKGEFADAWVVETVIDPPVDGFRVQLGTFKSGSSAISFSRIVETEIDAPVYIVKSADIWIVRVGNFVNKTDADGFSEGVKKKGYSDAFVTADKVYK